MISKEEKILRNAYKTSNPTIPNREVDIYFEAVKNYPEGNCISYETALRAIKKVLEERDNNKTKASQLFSEHLTSRITQLIDLIDKRISKKKEDKEYYKSVENYEKCIGIKYEMKSLNETKNDLTKLLV